MDVLFKSISTISANNEALLTGILQNNSYNLLKPLFSNCMDRTTINSLGVAPLQPYRFLSIAVREGVCPVPPPPSPHTAPCLSGCALLLVPCARGWQSLDDVAAAAGVLVSEGMSPLFQFSAVIDAMDPSTMIAEFDQGGFTLPSRDMYLTPSQLLTDYQTHITKVRPRLRR